MLADADHLAVVQNDDLVRVHNGADALRDDHSCGVGKLLRDAGSDGLVGLVVECREGVVKNQDLGLGGDRSRDTQTLLLTAGEVGTALRDLGIIAVALAISAAHLTS